MPETGTAVIFNHDVWHEGSPVTGLMLKFQEFICCCCFADGIKYILRTDIMFERIEKRLTESILKNGRTAFTRSDDLRVKLENVENDHLHIRNLSKLKIFIKNQ